MHCSSVKYKYSNAVFCQGLALDQRMRAGISSIFLCSWQCAVMLCRFGRLSFHTTLVVFRRGGIVRRLAQWVGGKALAGGAPGHSGESAPGRALWRGSGRAKARGKAKFSTALAAGAAWLCKTKAAPVRRQLTGAAEGAMCGRGRYSSGLARGPKAAMATRP